MTRAHLLSLALGLVLSAAGAEAALRLFAPQDTLAQLHANNPAMFVASDWLPYALRPGYRGRLRRREFDVAVTIDSAGYRGPELGPAGRRFRILAIGDSFTFGFGVEDSESYPSRLAQILAGRNVEVINAGFAAGYYPDTYYLYLRRRGLELAPDLIVVGFFVGNDIDHRRLGENRWLAVDDAGLPLAITNLDKKVEAGYLLPRGLPLRYEIPLLRDSHVFQLVASHVAALRRVAPSRPRRAEEATGPIPWNYRPTYAARTERAVRNVQRLFLGMRALAGRTPLVVLMIPERIQVGPPPPGWDVDKPQRIFRRFFREKRIAFLDLLPQIRAEAAPVSLYFPIDRHFNRRGQDFAARRLAAFLVHRDLVPPAPRAIPR
ncbi:MAG: hypothetical protein ACE5IL_14315 [Myxococcota bacterium]